MLWRQIAWVMRINDIFVQKMVEASAIIKLVAEFVKKQKNGVQQKSISEPRMCVK